MHRLSVVAFALVAVSLLAPAALADDQVELKRVEIWARGDDRKEQDVTTLDSVALERLHKQMAGDGFTHVERYCRR